ncbi:hypothetical protein Tco_1316952 [Tanacetum coccineum]
MDQLDKLQSEFSDLKGNYKKAQEECTSLKDQLTEAQAAAARSADELVCSESKLSERALIMRDLENRLVFQESETQKYKDMSAYAEHHFDDLWSDVTRFMSSALIALSGSFFLAMSSMLPLLVSCLRVDRGRYSSQASHPHFFSITL